MVNKNFIGNKKKSIILMIFGILAALLIIGMYKNVRNKSNEILISEMKTTYAFDVNDLETVIGDADYVFVAKIEKKLDTEYKYPVEVNGTTESTPYTNYMVNVMDNIKGNLPTEENIEIQKAGGISKDGKIYYVYEDDIIIEDGKYYIMFAYAQPDGTLLISGANSTLEAKKDYKNSKNYIKSVKASHNEKKSKRLRYSFANDKN